MLIYQRVYKPVVINQLGKGHLQIEMRNVDMITTSRRLSNANAKCVFFLLPLGIVKLTKLTLVNIIPSASQTIQRQMTNP